MVMPPTSLICRSAAAPSPSWPETMTSLPLQYRERERRKTVITSGQRQAYDSTICCCCDRSPARHLRRIVEFGCLRSEQEHDCLAKRQAASWPGLRKLPADLSDAR